MAVRSISSLREHLREAIQIEMSVVPAYLYAMYSIKDTRSDAYAVIRSVAVEEMLHVALVSNLLLSVGEVPRLFSPETAPRYPMPLPHRAPPLVLHLSRCTRELVRDVFMEVEKPEAPQAAPEAKDYKTLGQFYAAIRDGFTYLAALYPTRLFGAPHTWGQLDYGYSPVVSNDWNSGHLVRINSVEAAYEALSYITTQGEGVLTTHYDDLSRQELAHYFKFRRLAEGLVPIGDVWPVATDPTASRYEGSVKELAELFNGAYSYLLMTLDEIFSQGPNDHLVYGGMSALMNHVLRPIAELLVSLPVAPGSAEHVGPTFELIDLGPIEAARHKLVDRCKALVSVYPSLEGVLRWLQKVPDLYMR